MNNFLILVSSSADCMLAMEKSCNCGQRTGFEQRNPARVQDPVLPRRALTVRCHGCSLGALMVVIVRGASQKQDKVMTVAELAH